MTQSIFSKYSIGENRVTSTIIQVLKHLPVNVVEHFLAMFSESETQGFIKFINQPKGDGSIPDAEISAKFTIYFETKIEANSINPGQLEKHLDFSKKTGSVLVYLTPDNSKPKELESKAVVWKSFQDLHDLISELISDPSLILSERDQFLFRNLQDFIEESDLLPAIDEVVIVAASTAWPVYQKHGIYVCQANRSFRDVKLIGFYADGKIQTKIAEISCVVDLLDFSEIEKIDDPVFKEKLQSWLKDNDWAKNEKLKVFNLSSADDDKTKILPNPVVNNLISKSGRGTAFTQGQRYVLLAKLNNSKKTSDLVQP